MAVGSSEGPSVIELLAHSGDPFELSSLLHPGAYSGSSYFQVAERLASVYLIPLFVVFAGVAGIRLLMSRRYSAYWSAAVIAFLPGALWLMLVYEDASHKGTVNLVELSSLGALVGLVVGIDGRLLRPSINGVTTTWLLCVFALALWLFVPAYPARPVSF